MKKILLALVIFSTIIFTTGCEKQLTDAQKFKEEYESLNEQPKPNSQTTYQPISIDENHIIKYSNLEEINAIITEGTGIIYLGFPTCPWCRNAIPVLLEAASNTSLDKIYYVNMYEIRDIIALDENNQIYTKQEAQEGYQELLQNLDSILSDYTLTDSEGNTYSTGEKRVLVPLVIFIKDGEIVDHHLGTVESQTDAYSSLNNEQYQELYQIYTNGIHKVLDDMCTETGAAC